MSKPLTLYGIKQCDTCRKAQAWLRDAGVAFHFHDFRIDGIRAEQVSQWLQSAGAERLVNRRSTTWRSLTETERSLSDEAAVLALLLRNATLMKRPVLCSERLLAIGFSGLEWAQIIHPSGAQ